MCHIVFNLNKTTRGFRDERNTRSNRVAIISSVIARIFFNPVQYRDGHIFNLFNKDTREVFILCIYACASYLFVIVIHYLFICARLFIVVVHLFCSLFDYLFVFIVYSISY
jgi:hypothetical protein